MLSMSVKPASPVRRVWYRWKALRLPWRKKFLVGLDLFGNTYWEFQDALSSNRHRMRRIVNCASPTQHSDVSLQISPAWHQWLRHTRRDPPSLTEQAQDVVRQERLKVLAAQADARWAEKPSFLELPREVGRPVPELEIDRELYGRSSWSMKSDGGIGIEEREDVARETKESQNGALKSGIKNVPDEYEHPSTHSGKAAEASNPEAKVKEDPWKMARGGPSEEWQPRAWDPNTALAKR